MYIMNYTSERQLLKSWLVSYLKTLIALIVYRERELLSISPPYTMSSIKVTNGQRDKNDFNQSGGYWSN